MRKQKVMQTAKHTLVKTGREHMGAPGSIFTTYLEIQTLSRLKHLLECPMLAVTRRLGGWEGRREQPRTSPGHRCPGEV